MEDSLPYLTSPSHPDEPDAHHAQTGNGLASLRLLYNREPTARFTFQSIHEKLQEHFAEARRAEERKDYAESTRQYHAAFALLTGEGGETIHYSHLVQGRQLLLTAIAGIACFDHELSGDDRATLLHHLAHLRTSATSDVEYATISVFEAELIMQHAEAKHAAYDLPQDDLLSRFFNSVESCFNLAIEPPESNPIDELYARAQRVLNHAMSTLLQTEEENQEEPLIAAQILSLQLAGRRILHAQNRMDIAARDRHIAQLFQKTAQGEGSEEIPAIADALFTSLNRVDPKDEWNQARAELLAGHLADMARFLMLLECKHAAYQILNNLVNHSTLIEIKSETRRTLLSDPLFEEFIDAKSQNILHPDEVRAKKRNRDYVRTARETEEPDLKAEGEIIGDVRDIVAPARELLREAPLVNVINKVGEVLQTSLKHQHMRSVEESIAVGAIGGAAAGLLAYLYGEHTGGASENLSFACALLGVMAVTGCYRWFVNGLGRSQETRDAWHYGSSPMSWTDFFKRLFSLGTSSIGAALILAVPLTVYSLGPKVFDLFQTRFSDALDIPFRMIDGLHQLFSANASGNPVEQFITSWHEIPTPELLPILAIRLLLGAGFGVMMYSLGKFLWIGVKSSVTGKSSASHIRASQERLEKMAKYTLAPITGLFTSAEISNFMAAQGSEHPYNIVSAFFFQYDAQAQWDLLWRTVRSAFYFTDMALTLIVAGTAAVVLGRQIHTHWDRVKNVAKKFWEHHYLFALFSVLSNSIASVLGGKMQTKPNMETFSIENLGTAVFDSVFIPLAIIGFVIAVSGSFKRVVSVAGHAHQRLRDIDRNFTPGLKRKFIKAYEVPCAIASGFIYSGYCRNRIKRPPTIDIPAGVIRAWIGWDSHLGTIAHTVINAASLSPMAGSVDNDAAGTLWESTSEFLAKPSRVRSAKAVADDSKAERRRQRALERRKKKQIAKALKSLRTSPENASQVRAHSQTSPDTERLATEARLREAQFIVDAERSFDHQFLMKLGQKLSHLHILFFWDSMRKKLWVPLKSLHRAKRLPPVPHLPASYFYAGTLYDILMGEHIDHPFNDSDDVESMREILHQIFSFIDRFSRDPGSFYVTKWYAMTLAFARESRHFGKDIESFFETRPELEHLLGIDLETLEPPKTIWHVEKRSALRQAIKATMPLSDYANHHVASYGRQDMSLITKSHLFEHVPASLSEDLSKGKFADLAGANDGRRAIARIPESHEAAEDTEPSGSRSSH